MLGFKRTKIVAFEVVEGDLELDVAPTLRIARCSGCGCRARRVYDARDRRWRHVDLGPMKVHLRYRLRRVNCGRCGIVTEMVPWAAHDSWFTMAFEDQVAYLAQHSNKTVVADLMRVAWPTVGNVAERVVRRHLPDDLFDDLRRIGVDELSYRRHHEYITIVIDHDNGRVIWARPGKNAATLAAFFRELGPERCAKLERVSIDMSVAYENAVRAFAPTAEIVFDRFHVQRLVHDALDEVRRAEVRAAVEVRERRKLKNTRFALHRRPWNRTDADRAKLSELQHANRRIYRAYMLKEGLAAVLDGDAGPAETKLREWIRWARRSQLAPFARAAATIRARIYGVLAYCETHLTNAAVEGTNGKIRTITRRSFGFHSSSSLISLLFLCCTGIRLRPLHAAHP
jgi:transposase